MSSHIKGREFSKYLSWGKILPEKSRGANDQTGAFSWLQIKLRLRISDLDQPSFLDVATKGTDRPRRNF